MRENEFEKKVQHEMKEFGLQPSPDVWVEVEKRIRKEKKRRFVFWWLIGIVALGGGLAGLLLLTAKEQNPIARRNPVETEKTIPVRPAQAAPVADEKNTSIELITTKNTNDVALPEKQVVNANSIATKKRPGQREAKPLFNQSIQGNNKSTKDKVNDGQPAPDIDQVIIQQQKNAPVSIFDGTDRTNRDTISRAATHMISTIPKMDTAITARSADKKEDTTMSATAVNNRQKKNPKWEFGVNVNTGLSSITNGLRFSGSYAFATPNASLGGLPAGNGGEVITRFKSSASFSIAVLARRPIGKKIDLTIGAGYSYLSARMKTGQRVDSARIVYATFASSLPINNFYRTGNSNNYTNSFHFIGLSADISWKVVAKKKFSMNWENGISYGRLLGSNMLHYSPVIKGYYEDDRLLSKDHFFVNTGLSFPLTKKITVGPYASYGLSPIIKDNYDYRTNFLNYGIRLKFFPGKK